MRICNVKKPRHYRGYLAKWKTLSRQIYSNYLTLSASLRNFGPDLPVHFVKAADATLVMGKRYINPASLTTAG